MNEQARYKLNRLKRNYFLYRFVEIVLPSSGLGLIACSILDWLQVWPLSIKILISILSGFGSLTALFFHHKLYRLTDRSFTQFLNQSFPQLKESADLMLLDESQLTSLQQLQRIKTIEQFNLIYPSITLPHHIIRSSVILLISFSVYFGVSFSGLRKDLSQLIPDKKIQVLNEGARSVSIRSVAIEITPPQYTGLKSFTSANFDLRFPEGSNIRWHIEFSGKPKDVKLIFAGKDPMRFGDKDYTLERKFIQSSFYQIQWSDDNVIHQSDYFQLDVIKDQPPKVELKNLQQFTKLKYIDLAPFTVSSALSDDYGVSDAILIATVSKGSGESVKFREEKLRFTSPQKIAGRNLIASRSLDLKNLGLEPGDELYFYAETWDNKIPSANYSRTETFFIAVQDTATEITSVDSGLGVDLMPEYFRSQRQIIIDTEKLLRDKKRISKFEFNSTSNELGYDQKVLRLRYGQFLGEEDEGGIGQEAAQPEEGDVTKQYGHTHDTKNEHNLVQQKKDAHGHEDGLKNPEEKEDPIKEFAHSHDNTEEATFFVQSLKAKLKAAVTIMWDAELYLRLYEPDKSLSYQYKALNLLKEISNDSRIYVHRSGFDPPPLKEDKRLTADLSEIKTNTNQYLPTSEKDYSAIRQALIVVEKMLTERANVITNENRIILSRAGQELSIKAIENPLIHLKSLSLLKSLIDDQVKPGQMHDALSQIRKSFWNVLPQQPPAPNKHSTSSTKLDQEFLRSFEKIRND